MKEPNKQPFPFTKINYILLLIAVVSIIAGYGAMLLDHTPHGFGFLSLTLGPILLVIGLILPFFAIMYGYHKK
jgi:hypothetical protein